MREGFGQSVQPKVQDADHQHEQQQDYAHYNHKHVGFTWNGDERRQMIRSGGVNRIHIVQPLRVGAHCGS
jgi:hypothetical protein